MLFADAGVIMLMVYWPVAIVALLPIIYLEARIGSRLLNEPLRPCILAALLGNLFSTLIGIPLTWYLLVMFEMMDGGGKAYGLETFPKALYAVTVQAPWLIPYEHDLWWMVPAAVVVLSVPFYMVSVAAELLAVKWFFPEHSLKRLLRWMIVANGWSYGLLIVLTIGWTAVCSMF